MKEEILRLHALMAGDDIIETDNINDIYFSNKN
jgi:hypothetical protein